MRFERYKINFTGLTFTRRYSYSTCVKIQPLKFKIYLSNNKIHCSIFFSALKRTVERRIVRFERYKFKFTRLIFTCRYPYSPGVKIQRLNFKINRSNNKLRRSIFFSAPKKTFERRIVRFERSQLKFSSLFLHVVIHIRWVLKSNN